MKYRSIGVKEDTYQKLLELAFQLSLKKNKKLSFDETIRYLIQLAEAEERNKQNINIKDLLILRKVVK
jgi:predicted CopG family antitoxin